MDEKRSGRSINEHVYYGFRGSLYMMLDLRPRREMLSGYSIRKKTEEALLCLII